ncbi:MAG: Ig domain-containing protein [Candidatus Fimenecus sp.]
MKRIKRMLAVVAAFVILLSVIFAVPVSAASVTYSCTSASGAKGDTVTVSVNVSSSIGVTSAILNVSFDNTKLQYVSGTPGSMFSTCTVNANGASSVQCTGMTMGDSNAKKSGTFATLKFKILAESGTAELKITPSSSAGDHCGVGTPPERLSPSVSNGRVTITKSVTGISLNTTSVSLKKGGTAQLTATVSPSDATNKTVTYSSSNSKVATVTSGGKITAVGGGTATITAKAGGKSATCKVTVSVAQTGITTSGSAERTVGIGSTLRLSVAKVPADATDNYSVTWSSSDTNIATVSSNGTVTGVALGTATITAKSNGWTASFKVTVTEKAEESSSDISSEESSSDVSEIESESTELSSTEAVTESTTAPSNTKKGFFEKLKSLFGGSKDDNSGNNSTDGSKSDGSSFFSGLIKKLNEKMNDENNKVTRFYHYCMVAASSAVMAAITIPVTAIITSAIYKNKMKKNGNNTNNIEQR